MNQKRIVWLDDIRCPYMEPWSTTLAHYVIVGGSVNQSPFANAAESVIHWVKSYDEFVNEISDYEDMPVAIFFDHDLGEDKSGMDCMKWFVDYIQDHNIDPNKIDIYFQSANPVGRENMAKLFSNYMKFYNANK